MLSSWLEMRVSDEDQERGKESVKDLVSDDEGAILFVNISVVFDLDPEDKAYLCERDCEKEEKRGWRSRPE